MKPILFNTEMVQAILDERKTVTRRVIKGLGNNLWIDKPLGDWTLSEKPYIKNGLLYWELQTDVDNSRVFKIKLPYKARDILYVRETWQLLPSGFDEMPPEMNYIYKASHVLSDECTRWRPSLHMPKEAARIFLKVTDVRVEKLQDITETQVRKEGFRDYLAADDTFYPSGYYFRQTWDGIIKKQDFDKYSWEANPWVWVIEFERVEVGNEH